MKDMDSYIYPEKKRSECASNQLMGRTLFNVVEAINYRLDGWIAGSSVWVHINCSMYVVHVVDKPDLQSRPCSGYSMCLFIIDTFRTTLKMLRQI